MFLRNKSYWKKIRLSAWMNLVVGILSLALAVGCSTGRWAERESVGDSDTMPVVYNGAYNINLYGKERLTRFDAHRYKKIYNALVKAGVTNRRSVIVPHPATDAELLLVHTPEWVEKSHDREQIARVFETSLISRLPQGFVEERIVTPFRLQTRGTMLAARFAVEKGMAVTLGGGFAHAAREGGEGFNLFADVPLAVAGLRADGWNGKIMIVDVDAHHGQGNAKTFRNDRSVYILDVYNRAIYPYRFERVDRAVPLEPGTGDEEYLEKFRKAFMKGLKRFRPKLVIYVAGVDAHKSDPLGGLGLSTEGIFNRDKLVIDECTARGIPLCMTLSGGYWPECWRASARTFIYGNARRSIR